MRALLTAQPTSASASLHALLIMTPVLPGFQNLLGPLLTSHVLLPCHQVLSTTGQPGPGHGKKLGHRSVDASGETTYKKVLSCWVGNGGRSAWAGRALPGPLGGLGVLAPGWAGPGPPSAPWWMLSSPGSWSGTFWTTKQHMAGLPGPAHAEAVWGGVLTAGLTHRPPRPP